MTPKIVQSFVIAIIGCSLFAGLVDHLFPSLLSGLGLTGIFALSLAGLKHFFIWQPLTYLFISPTQQGIHAGFLINLAFSMFVLWRMGSAICMTRGSKHFLGLFLGAGIFSALFAALPLWHTTIPHFYGGPTPAIFAMLVASMLLFPHMELMLFLTFPVKGKWLITIVLGSTLLIDLSNGLLIHFFINLGAMIFGYLYGILIWKAQSPFSALWSFEKFLHKATQRVGSSYRSTIDQYATSSSKIYDFRTGQRVIDDEEFLDACLTKISTEGKHSLTVRERFRLWRISKKKRQSRN